MNRGVLFAIGAYSIWGLMPIYWRLLQGVPAAEILLNRVIWSLLFALAILLFRRRWRWLRQARQSPRILLTAVATGAILALNWFTYIWAVNSGFIVETSLGYFINPLVTVLFGLVFLGERLRPGQWLAIAVAAAGVLYLTVSHGSLPWIALTLAISFAFYSLLRKTAALGALEGFSLEMGMLFLPALAYLLFLQANGEATSASAEPITFLLLAGTGVLTAIPLILFASAARMIKLATIGILQYIAPTGQFLLGVYVFGEPFTHARLIGFGLIWIALLVYMLEGLLDRRGEAVLERSLTTIDGL